MITTWQHGGGFLYMKKMAAVGELIVLASVPIHLLADMLIASGHLVDV